DLPASKMLAWYVARFGTVEINAPFYRMPNARTLAAWRDTAPAGFTFVLKAPQRITHVARLRDVDEPLRYFCDTARTLGDKLGPLLFQLPPNFKKATDRLGDLLAQLPPGLRAALEFRHASWFDDETYALLRARNAALCVADTEDGTTPTVATADWGYVRLRAVAAGDDALHAWIATFRRRTSAATENHDVTESPSPASTSFLIASVLPSSIAETGTSPARRNQSSITRRRVAPRSKRISGALTRSRAAARCPRRQRRSGGAIATTSSR